MLLLLIFQKYRSLNPNPHSFGPGISTAIQDMAFPYLNIPNRLKIPGLQTSLL